ncbi:hypothetical protein Tco_1078579 [Tanacetum coccineum]|uniref:Uncharacterized protein n=1 Tax=Tanacetum coccineum TaxID=301880 RepID=A0ABQ5HQA7_9ASTR
MVGCGLGGGCCYDYVLYCLVGAVVGSEVGRGVVKWIFVGGMLWGGLKEVVGGVWFRGWVSGVVEGSWEWFWWGLGFGGCGGFWVGVWGFNQTAWWWGGCVGGVVVLGVWVLWVVSESVVYPGHKNCDGVCRVVSEGVVVESGVGGHWGDGVGVLGLGVEGLVGLGMVSWGSGGEVWERVVGTGWWEVLGGLRGVGEGEGMGGWGMGIYVEGGGCGIGCGVGRGAAEVRVGGVGMGSGWVGLVGWIEWCCLEAGWGVDGGRKGCWVGWSVGMGTCGVLSCWCGVVNVVGVGGVGWDGSVGWLGGGGGEVGCCGGSVSGWVWWGGSVRL